MPPGGGLVVEGAGLQASVQDADESVRQPSEYVVVFDPFGALLVVEGAGAGRGIQGGEGLGVEGVDEPVVVHEAAASLRCQASSVAGVTGRVSAQDLRGMSRASAANQALWAGSYRTRPV
jgi:hypothetical protein